MTLLVLGSFHSLAPVAKPTKLATLFGDLLANSVQVMRPAVVSKMAVGLVVAGTGAVDSFAAGFCAVRFVVGEVCATAVEETRKVTKIATSLFIRCSWQITKVTRWKLGVAKCYLAAADAVLLCSLRLAASTSRKTRSRLPPRIL